MLHLSQKNAMTNFGLDSFGKYGLILMVLRPKILQHFKLGCGLLERVLSKLKFLATLDCGQQHKGENRQKYADFRAVVCLLNNTEKMAGVGGLEPTTLGFGDRCSTN